MRNRKFSFCVVMIICSVGLLSGAVKNWARASTEEFSCENSFLLMSGTYDPAFSSIL